jgi:hypothetical protein
VRTPLGDAWILASDEPAFRACIGPTAPARLLPSGDAYFLLQGRDRELLVSDPNQRSQLWTPRVWPGALLVGAEIAGTWRRTHGTLSVRPWRRLARATRQAAEAEVASMPLPGLDGPPAICWED